MHPFLLGSVSVCFLLWGCAAVVCIGGGTRVAVRAGFPAARSALALTLFGLSILLGSKLLSIAETWFFPFDSYLPPELRNGVITGARARALLAEHPGIPREPAESVAPSPADAAAIHARLEALGYIA